MTEAEWRACDDPRRMLEFVGAAAGERKLRLFGCACCRRVWDLLDDPRSRAAVEAAERYADGRATRVELLTAGNRAMEPAGRRGHRQQLAWSFFWVTKRNVADSLENVLVGTAEAAARVAGRDALAVQTADRHDLLAAYDDARAAAVKEQADLLRDLLGNPFRPSAVQPHWLSWNGGTVRRLAEAIYDRHRFGDLPVLADALEEAGCDDPELLAHCRSAGPHARGCWALDRLLRGE